MGPAVVEVKGKLAGNGVLIETKRGPIVLTVAHLFSLSEEEDIQVSVEGHPARLIACDEVRDLALLEVPKGLSGRRKVRRLGKPTLGFIKCVYAFRGPGEVEGRITRIDRDKNCVWVSLPSLQPPPGGLSGAPLFDRKGALVGLVTSADDRNECLGAIAEEIGAFLEENGFSMAMGDSRVPPLVRLLLLLGGAGILFLFLFIYPGPFYHIIWPIRPPPADIFLEIVEPVSGSAVDCPHGKPCPITVRGRTNLAPGGDYRIYVAVCPYKPYGGGWWPQKDPAILNPDGAWEASSVWLGCPENPPQEGDVFKVVAFIIHEHWRWRKRISNLGDLPRHVASPLVEIIVQ